jgi:hypothetical protein
MFRGEAMNNTLLKLTITLVALAMLGVRLFKPDLRVDSAALTILVIAAVPWLSSLVKGIELFGIKIELQEASKSQQEGSQPRQQQPARPAFIATDDYFSRALKYTPLEPLVGFIVTSAMVSPSLQWAAFFCLVLLTFAYSQFFLKVSFVHAVISTLGFCVWVFAIGGPFLTLAWYQRLYGGLALVLFTFVVPLFVYRDARDPT